VLPHGVNQYGSPQQPDNSWVTHLHGGEIPPSTDGFAEKWFGNAVTAVNYNNASKPRNVNPPFENPSQIELVRPSGNFDTYTYPMVQEEATIWFHDHTLGKTHHNVIAGPAGFFPVKEPAKHGALTAWTPPTATVPSALPLGSEYTWLDPVTEPRGALNIPMYDQFYAIQDRAFNDDGSINFSNGLGQPVALPGPGLTAITNGVNPQVHPTWVPEYFGDVALVNGVAWPKKSTEPGWYRLRLVDGSDSRCWTIGFQQSALPPAPGAAVTYNVPFFVIANDQGYLRQPVKAPQNRFTMCPGERYEVLVNFGALPGVAVGAAANVWMVNNAKAPFPAGIAPQGGFSPDLNVVMQFAVSPAFGPGVKSCGQTVKIGKVTSPIAPAALTWDPANMAANLATTFPIPVGFAAPKGLYANVCMPADPSFVTGAAAEFDAGDVRAPLLPPPGVVPAPALTFPAGTIVRQVYLNEKVDGATATPLGMQLNGVPFEYKVTETPKQGSKEVWQFVNLTVDAHPMHPHLVRHLVVARQAFNVGRYKATLCGSTTCQPGTAPGNEMQVVPDVNGLNVAGLAYLTGAPTYVYPTSVEGGFKDAVQAPPGMVTTIVADWSPRWNAAGTANAPGTAGCPNGTPGCAAPYVYEPVTSGPYVWHCHINSHEDSEMMRTSLVVAP
jgi:FtsP/CotA-like multicopper oxidase with cupredoxin domain